MNSASKIKTIQFSLKSLGALCILAPLVIYGSLAAYRYQEATTAAELRVNRSLRVAHEHASKVLGSAEALHERLSDLLDGKSLSELRSREPQLHAALKARMANQNQIQSIWIIGADGRAIATSFTSPPPAVDFSDRAYLAHHRERKTTKLLSEPFASRTTGIRIVDLSTRFNGPDGSFAGVINVSLHASYFNDFYADLANDEPGLAVNLFHEGGLVYARWPKLADASARLGAGSPTLKAVQEGKDSGQVRGVSSFDGQTRLISFQRVDSYPMFVGTGMNLSSIRADMLRELALLLALGLPPFAVIYFAARSALRRADETVAAAERLSHETATRRKAEEALLQAQKLEALGRLTGGVAHDFNNALMVVSNNAYLLKRHVNEAGESQLKSINRAVSSATKLTRQLLAFSRRQPLVPELVDLRDRLPSSRELLTPVLGSQIEFTINIAPDTRPITVDMAELELALLNLAINARDAMPSGGRFAVAVRNALSDLPAKLAGQAAVVIEAADTGVGIDPAALDKVFEPFFTTKPVGEGTGLGLSQVYGLCERAGGVAAVRSRPGLGTEVSLFFPASAQSVESPAINAAPVLRTLGKTVLVVEDNDDVAASLMPLLEALGCRGTRVARAAAAREWLDAQTALPDLVLSDVMMPGDMDGLALAEFLRKQRPDLPVLLMTGYAERMDAIARAGFEVLPKPCSPAMLSAAIAKATNASSHGPATVAEQGNGAK